MLLLSDKQLFYLCSWPQKHAMMVNAVGTSYEAAATMMDATSGETTEEPEPGSEPAKAEHMKPHSLPQKAAQSTSVDSDADTVGRLLQYPLTKDCFVFELACMTNNTVESGRPA